MARKRNTSHVSPHTEYARTRVRCPGCGETVARTASSDGRCARCSDGVT